MLRINIISTCEIGYKNTLARMESVCTLRLGLSVLINNISYTKQSNFVFTFFEHLKAFKQVLRDRPMCVLIVFGNGRGLLFVSLYTIV